MYQTEDSAIYLAGRDRSRESGFEESESEKSASL